MDCPSKQSFLGTTKCFCLSSVLPNMKVSKIKKNNSIHRRSFLSLWNISQGKIRLVLRWPSGISDVGSLWERSNFNEVTFTFRFISSNLSKFCLYTLFCYWRKKKYEMKKNINWKSKSEKLLIILSKDK